MPREPREAFLDVGRQDLQRANVQIAGDLLDLSRIDFQIGAFS